MLERKSGAALWHQIAAVLVDDIASGRRSAGSQMENEPELATKFGVSRNTVRRAMSSLEEKGLVRIEQGRGTFVHDQIIDYEITNKTRFSENLSRQGREPETIIIRVSEEPASERIAEMLRLKRGELVIISEGLSKANGAPLAKAFAYYPSARFPGLLGKRRTIASQTKLFASYSINDYSRLVTWITTRPPTDAEARDLQIPRSRPVFFTQKIDVDSEGAPLCYSESCWAGDRVQFVVGNSDRKAQL